MVTKLIDRHSIAFEDFQEEKERIEWTNYPTNLRHFIAKVKGEA